MAGPSLLSESVSEGEGAWTRANRAGASCFPKGDAEVSRISSSWKTVDPMVADAIHRLALQPDFACPENVLFMHRKDGADDYFFLSNQSGREIHVDARFRVTGRAPELLDPDTGLATAAAVYRIADGITTVPIVLDAAGSAFVFFRSPAAVPPALLGCDIEDDVLFVVLSRFGFCVLPEASQLKTRSVDPNATGRTTTGPEATIFIAQSISSPSLWFSGCRRSPGRVGVAGEVIVFKDTSDPVFGHAMGKNGDTES